VQDIVAFQVFIALLQISRVGHKRQVQPWIECSARMKMVSWS